MCSVESGMKSDQEVAGLLKKTSSEQWRCSPGPCRVWWTTSHIGIPRYHQRVILTAPRLRNAGLDGAQVTLHHPVPEQVMEDARSWLRLMFPGAARYAAPVMRAKKKWRKQAALSGGISRVVGERSHRATGVNTFDSRENSPAMASKFGTGSRPGLPPERLGWRRPTSGVVRGRGTTAMVWHRRQTPDLECR